MILIIKKQLPEYLLRPGVKIKRKNRVQCQKSFNGFPKDRYADLSVQVAKIVRLLRNLNNLSVEGRLNIQLENGYLSKAGCLWVYNMTERKLSHRDNIEHRLREIKYRLKRLAGQFPRGYKVIFKLRQSVYSVKQIL